MTPVILDLYCGAGGASMGYHNAGFTVLGVDIAPQPNYPFTFVQADAIEYLAETIAGGPLVFDAIHASPPCQRYMLINAVTKNAEAHPDMIELTRELLEYSGLPYVIENVVGARSYLRDPFQLCGTSFGLTMVDGPQGPTQLHRHRLFETNWQVGLVPPCGHQGKAMGVYGDHFRYGRRSHIGELSGPDGLDAGSEAMEIDWMTWPELREAIPPRYTQFIGEQLIRHLERHELECDMDDDYACHVDASRRNGEDAQATKGKGSSSVGY